VGNFDDAQSGVKAIFSDEGMARELDGAGVFLSSANSINWGRLAPQIAYYVSAYCDMVRCDAIKLGDTIDVCVPTGNFGNIFACYLAKLMGLPVGKLICASNKNDVLTEFLESGVYNKNRLFHTTMSPSMDILISSNLERLLYFSAGAEKTAEYMSLLNTTGAYTVESEVLNTISENFKGYFADEEKTGATIKDYFKNHSYLSDTHTAVALNCAEQYINETGDKTPMVVASTASPYKFAADVLKSITGTNPTDALKALDILSEVSGTEISYPLRNLAERRVRFTTTIEHENMLSEVFAFIEK